MGGQLGEFVFRRAEGQAGNVGDFIGDHLRKERMRVEAVPTAVPPKASSNRSSSASPGVEGRHRVEQPIPVFLAQGQRNGVHGAFVRFSYPSTRWPLPQRFAGRERSVATDE